MDSTWKVAQVRHLGSLRHLVALVNPAATASSSLQNKYINASMNNTQTLSISQLRQNATRAIEKVLNDQMPIVILQRSRPKAILVDLGYYQALEEAVFDLTDSQEADKAKKEKRIPFSFPSRGWFRGRIVSTNLM